MEGIITQIPYTIPYWKRIGRAIERWPKKLARRFNLVVDYFEWSCQTDLIVFLSVLLPAAGKFVLGLLDFDWDDVARGMLRPDMGGFGCLLFGRGRSKDGWNLPELGDEIGKRIPVAKVFKASRVWEKTRWLWVIDGIIQRAFYYWLLADLISDFIYGVALGTLRHPSCWEGGISFRRGYYTDSGANGPKAAIVAGPRSEVRGNPIDGVRVWVDGLETTRPIAILWSGGWQEFFPLGCDFLWRLEFRDSKGNIIQASPWRSGRSGGWQPEILVVRPPGPGRYWFGGRVVLSKCSVIAYVHEILAIKPMGRWGRGYEIPIWEI